MSSYKPYPSTGKPAQQERPPAPQSVQNAVKLMYVGAAISTVSIIVPLVTLGSVKNTIRHHYPHYTTSQVNHAYTQYIEAVIISSAFAILLWLLMAWANGKGMAWARIVSSVLFGVYSLELITSLKVIGAGIGLIFLVLTWLVGAGTIFFLWRPESSAYFKPQRYS